MVEPRFRWTFADERVPSEEAVAVAAARGISTRLAGLLAARGAVTADDLTAWFADPLEGLHDPAAPARCGDRAARAIRAARDRGRAGPRLRRLRCGWADRAGDHDPRPAPLRRRGRALRAEPARRGPRAVAGGDSTPPSPLGASLIITVDCGTTSVAEVAERNARGIDVIITDHHRVPPVLPAAFAIVNPHRPDSTYPDRRLAGSGVAFKVAQLLLADEPGGAAAALDLTDLATIGSVADVAPVVGENRAIARLGLERMRRAPRPGIAALLERARVAPAAVDLETVSFAIAPRLNAAGRVGEALEAARLLLADDAVEAATHADALEAANLTRRDLMKTAVGEARTAVAGGVRPNAATVVRGPWTVGIVGLVAARLVEDRGRPAVVGADLGDVVRASCRSDGSLDLGATLERCARPVHPFRWPCRRGRVRDRDGALGRVPDALPGARRRRRCRRTRGSRSRSTSRCRRSTSTTRSTASWPGLPRADPGNPDPLVAVLGLTVTRVRAATGGHSQLTLRRGLDVLDGIAFGRSDIAETVHEGDRLDVVARLTSRTFGGFESLQLDIRDVATSGSHPQTAAVLAARGDAALLAGTAS